MELLQDILEIPNIEKESFDFKNNKVLDKDYRLEDHICAFANTYGGHIVIGIEEKKTNGNYPKFILNGFPDGSQDDVLKKIAQKMWLIEPLPSYEVKTIESENRYYIILYIKSEPYKRPFFAKNNAYIRIGSSTLPANRNIILSMVNHHLIPHDNIKKHTGYIVDIYRQLTNLSLISNNEQYYLGLLNSASSLNNEFEKNILLIGKTLESNSILELNKVYHLDLAISHLKCEEHLHKFKIFEDINRTLNKINVSDIDNGGLELHRGVNYPAFIVDYFKHNYKTGYKLYMLILRFREEIYSLIKDLQAGDMLRGFCKMGY
ncbi:MAG: ATP-binding protein [Thermoproteota archaeon]|nr:ATP-binding protein [Thermoproteota archaeon]